MGDFKQLKVWGKSREVVKLTYRAASALPRTEQDSLASQMRRASVSVGANIAEGAGRQSPRDQARCYRIALGSARELEGLVIIADDLEMLRTGERDALLSPIEEVEKMLHALIRYCVRDAALPSGKKTTADSGPHSGDQAPASGPDSRD
jgi:four helix bundle protein